MKRRFLALRIISIIYKILAVLAFIGMIGGDQLDVLIDANDLPTIQDPNFQPIGVALGVRLWSARILCLAVAQFIDLLIALEMNTRATTAMLQQLGKVMKERL